MKTPRTKRATGAWEERLMSTGSRFAVVPDAVRLNNFVA
jgi:hypothetical protein